MGNVQSEFKVGQFVRAVEGGSVPVGVEGQILELVEPSKAKVAISKRSHVTLERQYLRHAFRVGDFVLWTRHSVDVPLGTCGRIKSFLPWEHPEQNLVSAVLAPDGTRGLAIVRKAEVHFDSGVSVEIPMTELMSYSFYKVSKIRVRESLLSVELPSMMPSSGQRAKTKFVHCKDLKMSEADKYHKNTRLDKFRTSPGAVHPVWCVAVAPKAKLLASSTADNLVHIWEHEDRPKPFELLSTIDAHKGTVWALEFSPNECFLATASADKSVCLWDLEKAGLATRKRRDDVAVSPPLLRLHAHTAGVRCLSFSKHGLLITGGDDHHLCVWEDSSVLPLQRWRAHEKEVREVCFSTCEGFSTCDSFSTKAIAVSFVDIAVSLGQDGYVAVWRAIQGACGLVCRFDAKDVGAGAVLSMDINPAEPCMVATGAQDGSAWLWSFRPSHMPKDPTATTSKVSLRGHMGAVWSVCFSYDGCLLATGSADRTVRVWNVSAHTCDKVSFVNLVGVFEAHDSFVRQVRFKFRCKLLVTCSTDGTVSLWKVPPKLRKLVRPRRVTEFTKLEPCGVVVGDSEGAADLTRPLSITAQPDKLKALSSPQVLLSLDWNASIASATPTRGHDRVSGMATPPLMRTPIFTPASTPLYHTLNPGELSDSLARPVFGAA